MPQRVQSKRDHYECKQRSEYQISQNPEMKINFSSTQDLSTNKKQTDIENQRLDKYFYCEKSKALRKGFFIYCTYNICQEMKE